MNTYAITPAFSATAQLNLSDIETVAKLGFKSIVCNRPNDEEEGQTNVDKIEEQAKKHGLKTHYLPIFIGNISQADIQNFSTQLKAIEAPALGYCLTGTRSALFYTLANLETSDKATLIEATKKAGYDVTNLLEMTIG